MQVYRQRGTVGREVKIGDPRAVPALIEALRDEEGWVRRAAAGALTKMLRSSDTLSPETADVVQRHVPALARTAARQKEYDLLDATLQFQASWRARQCPWQDPLFPPPRSPVIVWLERVGMAIAAVLLAGVLALLGVLIAGAGDVLKARLLAFLQSRPVLVVIGLLLLLAAVAAGIKALREQWLKRSQR